MKHDEGEGIPTTPRPDSERVAEKVATNLGPDRIFDSRVLKVHDHHYFEGILRPGDVYVEAGAHEGRFLHASGLYDPRCTYHLIEPQADLPQALWGSKPNVLIHPFVLAAESGDVTLYLRKKHTVGSTTVRSLTNWFRAKRVVKGVAWKDFYTEHVRFFAVNIEGSEYDLLRQVQPDQVDYMSVEFHPGKSRIDTEEYLREVLSDWRTLALTRLGDRYNVWFGQSPACTSE